MFRRMRAENHEGNLSEARERLLPHRPERLNPVSSAEFQRNMRVLTEDQGILHNQA